MHYGITLWAYLSEPLVKDNVYVQRKNYNTACSSHLIAHYRYVHVVEMYTETFHMKKIADLHVVTVSL